MVSSRFRRRIAVGLISAAFVIPAASASAAVVKGDGTRWRPARTDIARGGSVRWKAVLGNHVVQAYGGNWTYHHRIDQGERTKLRTFNRRGTFRFYCTIHGSVAGGTCTGMCGKIVFG